LKEQKLTTWPVPGLSLPQPCRKEAMVATIEIIRQEYDGVEGYLKNKCGFSDEDITTMRANLVVEEKAYVEL